MTIRKEMKIIFFGLGSIGQRHADILINNYEHQLFAFRSGIKGKQNPLGIKEIYSWNEVKDLKPDIAFITNPTSLHIETALKCAEQGYKLFIEKPIDKDLEGLKQLIKIVEEKNLVTYIAYNLRFHPVIEKLKEYFDKYNFLHMSVISTSYYPNWRLNVNFKESYSANSSMGGGIILDLSHEIDFTQFLLGTIKSIQGQFSKRSDVTVDAEDYADMLIQTDKGPSNLHINFFSQIKQRIIQLDFQELTVVADLVNSTIEEFKNEEKISRKEFENERNISFEKQIKYFFDNIDNTKMMNNLTEASNLYKKIIVFKNE